MAEFDNEIMEEEFVEDDGGRDLSTVAGVAIIAGGGVVVYEGCKRIGKFVAPKVKGLWTKLRGKGDGDGDETVNPEPTKVEEAKTE